MLTFTTRIFKLFLYFNLSVCINISWKCILYAFWYVRFLRFFKLMTKHFWKLLGKERVNFTHSKERIIFQLHNYLFKATGRGYFFLKKDIKNFTFFNLKLFAFFSTFIETKDIINSKTCTTWELGDLKIKELLTLANWDFFPFFL